MRIRILTLLLVSTMCQFAMGQLAPGQWQDHLAYRKAIKVAVAKEGKVYCCSTTGLFYYNTSDQSVNTISRVQGLSDVEIVSIVYAAASDALVVAYANANIDIIKNNKVVNFPHIKNKFSIADKTINNVSVYKNKVFVSTNFGIVKIDADKMQVDDTYMLSEAGVGLQVKDVCTNGASIYAATNKGIFFASYTDDFLADNTHWQRLSLMGSQSVTNVELYNNSLFALYTNHSAWWLDSVMVLQGTKRNKVIFNYLPVMYSIDSTAQGLLVSGEPGVYLVDANAQSSFVAKSDYAMQAAYDAAQTLWIADNRTTLTGVGVNGELSRISPQGPYFNESRKSAVFEGTLYTATGGPSDNWTPSWETFGFNGFANGSWFWHNGETDDIMTSSRDIMNVAIDPQDVNHVFFASWDDGLLEFNNGDLKQYTPKNSTLQYAKSLSDPLTRVYGLAFDDNSNLWITNSDADSSLHVRLRNGKWVAYSLKSAFSDLSVLGDVLVTSWGHKWIAVQNTTHIIVFDDNQTPENKSDDRRMSISIADVPSLTRSTAIYCIAEDRDGEIWVGTDAGPVEISNGQSIFDDGQPSAKKITVPLKKGDTDAAYLLETERVNSITVDGNNRKWMGTQNSGAYLFTADGYKQVNNFTVDNSPMLSNTIFNIAVDHKSGEVYFSTDKGLISYRGYATKGIDEFGDVYVFPNPVRNDYTGDIIVTNLLQDADVRITDISGNLVFQTKALGGQAVWNGKNYLGHRVNTGIYLVFCANSDGTKTYVTKLLFVH